MAHAPGVAGAKVTMPISLTVQPETKIAALQWSLIYPESDIASVNVAAAPAAQAAGKTVVCAAKRGSAMCLLFGMNSNVMPDGVFVEVTFELSEWPHPLIGIELKTLAAARVPANGLRSQRILNRGSWSRRARPGRHDAPEALEWFRPDSKYQLQLKLVRTAGKRPVLKVPCFVRIRYGARTA